MRMRTAICLAVLSCLACQEKKAEETGPEPTASAPAAPPPAPAPTPTQSAPPPPPAAPKVDIHIESVANTMTFDKKKLTVPAGAEVHLTLKNNATMSTLPHNWVLVTKGSEAAVAAEGLAKASDAGYVVAGPNVLAFSPMAKPGETVEFTFTAPAPGDYPYICTYPGHYMMMKGVLTVTP